MAKNKTILVTILSVPSGLVSNFLEVAKAQYKAMKEKIATKIEAQAKFLVMIEVYSSSNKNKLVAKIIEKKTLITETPF